MDDHERASLDRRSFLKAAATGGAALVGGQALSAQQAERSATAASAQADASTVVEIVNDERPRVRLHDGCAQAAGVRVHHDQPPLRFRRTAGIHHQLNR